jgi:hypothetical protein
LITRDTVFRLTPASAATSFMVGRDRGPGETGRERLASLDNVFSAVIVGAQHT